MGWLSFTSLPFLVAGAIFATGPLIIHLLNRRRYLVVQWAAMEYLLESQKRNRNWIWLKQLLLLLPDTSPFCQVIQRFGYRHLANAGLHLKTL